MKKFILFSLAVLVTAALHAQTDTAAKKAYNEAKEAYNEALKLKPEDTAAKKAYNEAKEAYNEALKLKSDNAPKNDISSIIQFKETDHDFGKIPYGKPAEFDLEMKNISSDSVRLENVVAGCGCTTPKWQPGPYAAGETFKIHIGFNGYTEGAFHKIVTIYFPGGVTQVINFHGETYKTPDNPAPGNGQVDKLKSGGGK